MKTKCNKCIFAITNPEVQTGCKLDRIQKYIDKGKAELNEDNYYTINGLCIACRDAKSASIYNDPVKDVLKEISPKITSLVDCTDSFNEEKITKIIESGIDQIILYFHKDKVSSYFKKMNELVSGTHVQFKITNFLEQKPEVYHNFSSVIGNYILVGVLTKEEVDKFRELIVKDVKSIILFHKDNENYIIQSLVYQYRSQDIEEILNFVKEEEYVWKM